MRDIKFVLFIVVLFSSSSYAAFTENSRRYVSQRDIFNLWAQKFPAIQEQKSTAKMESSCWSVDPQNVNVIGAINPSLGKAAADLPSPGFVRWIGTCLTKVVAAQFVALSEQPANDALWKKYWPQNVLTKFKDEANTENPYHKISETPWSDVPQTLQRGTVQFTIEEMIGPEPVIKDLGFVKSMSQLIDVIAGTVPADSNKTLLQVTQDLLVAVGLREEFLTY